MPRSQTADADSNRYRAHGVKQLHLGDAHGTVSTQHADKVILVAGFTGDCIDSATKC